MYGARFNEDLVNLMSNANVLHGNPRAYTLDDLEEPDVRLWAFPALVCTAERTDKYAPDVISACLNEIFIRFESQEGEYSYV